MSQLDEHLERTIVIVDDNANFNALLRGMLREFGFQWVQDFTDPREAFIYCTKVHVDVIFTDLMMKPFDGFQFVDKVRHADVVVNRVVPIILATGVAGRKHILQAISHGIDEVLVKPFSARQLYERLIAVLGRPRVYIKTPSGYFGPDRRRRNDPRYHGPERRKKDEAVIVDEAMLLAMREEQKRKYGRARPSPLEPEVIEPLLVGPILTIPLSVVAERDGPKTVARVPTPVRQEIAAAAPAALPASATQPAVVKPSAPVPVAQKPKEAPQPVDQGFHFLD